MKEKENELMALAAQVRDEVYAREAIAKGFELVAGVLRGDCVCEDCQQQGSAGEGNTPGADETLKIPGA